MNVRAAFGLILMSVLVPTDAADRDPPKEAVVAVHFPTIAKNVGKPFSSVRIVLSCARVSAITRIPNDWYVETLLPAHRDDSRWKEFQFSSQAVELSAGHGASRLIDLAQLNGTVRIAIDDAKCFDIAAIVEDDLGGDGWPKTTIKKKELALR